MLGKSCWTSLSCFFSAHVNHVFLFYSPLLRMISLNKQLISIPQPVHVRSPRKTSVIRYFNCFWSNWIGSLGLTVLPTTDVTSTLVCAASFLSDWVWGHSRAVLPIVCPSGSPSVLFIFTHAPSDSWSVCQVKTDEAWLLLPVLPVCSVPFTDPFFPFNAVFFFDLTCKMTI